MIRKIWFVILLVHYTIDAQEEKKHYSLDVNNFFGTVAKHNPDISHLITGHPSGIILSANHKTFGTKDWQRLYNYPDYGVSFIYQNMDNQFLGVHYGLFLHYNFYFFKRWLSLRLGQGVSYATKPYDAEENFRNIAYGSHLQSSTYFLWQLKKENLLDRFGVQLGLGAIHYSNGNSKAPNTSTNTVLINVGLTYSLDQYSENYIEKEKGLLKGSAPIGCGFIFRSGINESDLVGSGRYPFYTLVAYADKKLNKKSTLLLGTELFFSQALERYIDFRAVGVFDEGTTGDEQAKRVGTVFGHDLRIGRGAITTKVGY